MPQDSLSQKTHNELEDVASKHHDFTGFMQEVQRLAETVWHNARAHGHDPYSVVGDSVPDEQREGAENPAEPQGDDENGDNTEGDGGQPVTTPAEPASPSSENGFPTTNVDIQQESQPVQPSP